MKSTTLTKIKASKNTHFNKKRKILKNVISKFLVFNMTSFTAHPLLAYSIIIKRTVKLFDI